MNNPSQEEVEQLKQSLPRIPLVNNRFFINYQGSWIPEYLLCNILKFQRNFIARDTDIFVTGLPKTGTTWLKSLLFTIVTRVNYPISESPLLKNHPQELVYNLEGDLYGDAFDYPKPHHLDELACPRLLGTHLSYTSLPESIRTSKCRILYICRNPLDTIVSFFHFATSIKKLKYSGDQDQFQPPRFEDVFEEFYNGTSIYGPFLQHVVAYWKMSLEQPDKVLFLKYEDLKDDPVFHLRRIADSIGMSFSPAEENEGVINQIIEICSIGNMKELEVNKNGVINKFFEKKSYFRKGEVGDWSNYFTPTMVEKITKLMDEKLEGTGLSFKINP